MFRVFFQRLVVNFELPSSVFLPKNIYGVVCITFSRNVRCVRFTDVFRILSAVGSLDEIRAELTFFYGSRDVILYYFNASWCSFVQNFISTETHPLWGPECHCLLSNQISCSHGWHQDYWVRGAARGQGGGHGAKENCCCRTFNWGKLAAGALAVNDQK